MKITTYDQAREYLESFIRPILFQKVTVKNGQQTDPLDRFRHFMDLLGNPQDRFRSVHVSGTSGKGSTAYLISHILTTAGYRTGLSVSPHLERLNERLQINGEELPDEKLIALINRIVPSVEQMKDEPLGEPSYFELLLGLAFLYFAEEAVEIAIIEVGIEGKYDATNILKPILTVLTNISLDHTHILGDTEEKIAREAISVIRNGIPLVSGITQPEILKIVEDRCREFKAPLLLSGRDFSIAIREELRNGMRFTFSEGDYTTPELMVSLPGHFQGENTALAIAAIRQLVSIGFHVTDKQLLQALTTASFAGRFELLTTREGTVILDGAHNPAKLTAFITSLEQLYPHEEKIFLIAFKKNKDVADLIRIIRPAAEFIIFTEFQQTTDLSMRAAIPVGEIKQQLERAGELRETDRFIVPSAKALEEAKLFALQRHMTVVVTGSLYLVGEIRGLLKNMISSAA